MNPIHRASSVVLVALAIANLIKGNWIIGVALLLAALGAFLLARRATR